MKTILALAAATAGALGLWLTAAAHPPKITMRVEPQREMRLPLSNGIFALERRVQSVRVAE